MPIRVPRKPTDAYQHGNLRQALIQAGLKLLTEAGVGGLSLRAAAQLAGVSHAAPYRHFADKDALVAAIGEEGFRLLTARMLAEVAATAPTNLLDRLRALGLGYVGFAVEHPAYLRVIFGGVARSVKETPGLQAAGAEAYQTLRDAVADGVQAGELREADVDMLALSCWSSMHGFSMLVVDQALPPELCGVGAAQTAAATLMGHLYQGIARPPKSVWPRTRPRAPVRSSRR